MNGVAHEVNNGSSFSLGNESGVVRTVANAPFFRVQWRSVRLDLRSDVTRSSFQRQPHESIDQTVEGDRGQVSFQSVQLHYYRLSCNQRQVHSSHLAFQRRADGIRRSLPDK